MSCFQQLAVALNSEEMVQLLLDRGANPNSLVRLTAISVTCDKCTVFFPEYGWVNWCPLCR